VRCDRTAASRARVVEKAIAGDPLPLLVGGRREREGREVRPPLPRCAEAAQRRAAPDAARIEAHEVELRSHRIGVQRRTGEDRELDARAAGAARIEEQRSDPLRRIAGGRRTSAIEIVAPFGAS